MVSEISRLLPEDIRLNHPVPHLVIKNRTKKEARKRVIPVVLGLNFIRHHLNDTIEWLNKVTGATHSARIKQLMRNVTGNKNLSAHWLRHSFRANAQLAGADILTIASIAGWSDAQKHVSQDLIKYSAEAITQSALLKRLFEENLRIQAKLIDVENKLLAASNVVSIRTNRSEVSDQGLLRLLVNKRFLIYCLRVHTAFLKRDTSTKEL
jgi:hypothetical protein